MNQPLSVRLKIIAIWPWLSVLICLYTIQMQRTASAWQFILVFITRLSRQTIFYSVLPWHILL